MNGDLHNDQHMVAVSTNSTHLVEPQALNLVSTSKAAVNAQVTEVPRLLTQTFLAIDVTLASSVSALG